MSIEDGPLGIQYDHESHLIIIPAQSSAGALWEYLIRNFPEEPKSELLAIIDPDVKEHASEYQVHAEPLFISPPMIIGLVFEAFRALGEEGGLELYEAVEKLKQKYAQ